MSFVLKYKDLNEEREISNENYSIKDLLDELELSAQTIVSKQNGELVIEDTIIEDGDEIHIDIPNRELTLRVDDAVIEERRKHFTPLPTKIKKGYLKRYSTVVSSSDKGAVTSI